MAKQGRNGRTLSKRISRKTLKIFRNVLIRVPKNGKYMFFVPENKKRKIEAHWKNGFVVDRKEILFRFFYNITEADLGFYVVADIKVMEKKMKKKDRIFDQIIESEISYLYLDIEKISNTNRIDAEFGIKFWSCDPEHDVQGEEEFFIPRTRTKVAFIDREAA